MNTFTILLLRFDAVLMSFGAEMVDAVYPTREFPGRSMLTGMLGAALGIERTDAAALDSIQRRLDYAVREDRRGSILREYQTVDLGTSWMDPGWTTDGQLAERKGQFSGETHQKYPQYIQDAVYTIALRLDPWGDPAPDEAASALVTPSWPLRIGRLNCMPSERIFLDVVEAESVIEAVRAAPLSPRADKDPVRRAWASDPAGITVVRTLDVTDERDFRNGIVVGRRRVYEGRLEVGP